MVDIQTTDLSRTFQALRNRDPLRVERQVIEKHPDYRRIPQNNYAPVAAVNTGGWGNGMARFASGITYGQPQFFSPVHTPINWQIPSKRLEQYQWARFFYENEPKVAAAIDFYSEFPMSNWEHECKNREVKIYFDKFKKRLNLPKWCRLMSHEIHLLGDCFPFIEISCENCNGTGRLGSDICDHEGGTVRRVVILNPDFVEVHTSPLNPEPIIALRPDEELINMVQRKTPGYDTLSSEVRSLISSGQPIRLDNHSVAHLKYGECGYQKYGIGMVRRLFPILSYKTKLMVAQWIVAERLIVPIKVVKVGSDERPAGPADIAAVQSQLAQTANDPNLTIVTHHAFEMDWVGTSGKVLTLSNEFEFINQEILDGMMINNALLNGEGPNFGSASVGIEAMIQRLATFREQITEWLENVIYIPEARRQGFVEKNEDTGEEEVIVPKIKWNSMHLRDQQQYRTFVMQLYEKGLLSAQTVLEVFDFDPDQEIERKRYDALQMAALGQNPQGGAGGGAGGGGGMGGLPMPSGGGGGDAGGMGGEPPIGAGGEAGGAPAGGGEAGGAAPISKSSSLSAQVANPSEFGGRVLRQKTRERISGEKQKQQKMYEQQQKKVLDASNPQAGGTQRDEKGRIIFTKAERDLLPHLLKARQDGLFGNVSFVPQFRVSSGDSEYAMDFAFPQLKIGVEADGEIFHSAPKQVAHDKERDMKLAQQGWTVLRFTDTEIEKRSQQVIQQVIKTVMQKQLQVKNLSEQKPKL
jgi:very-short-patch-repair endonuclease